MGIIFSSFNGLEPFPKLRFKDKNGNDYLEWKTITIKDALKYEQPQRYIVKIEDYNNSYPIPVLTANKAFILGYTKETEGIYNKGDTIIYDDFTMDLKFVKFNFKVKSSAIKILTSKNGFNLFFIFCLLTSLNLKPQGHQRSYISILEPMKVWCPTFEEQQKIADFLSLVDQRIEKQRQLVESLKKYKRGLFFEIFEQKRRFKDGNNKFYPKWEKKSLGTIFKERTERAIGNEELLSVTINSGVKKRCEVDVKDNSSDDKSKYKKLYPNDIAYNTMRMWQGASGVSLYEGIVSPAYTVITPIIPVKIGFFGYYFKYIKTIQIFQKFSQGLTSDTWNLKYPQLSEIQLLIPNIEEQEKIYETFKFLDDKILLSENTLNLLQDIKKGLLQKMFI